MMERLFEVNSDMEGKHVSRCHTAGSLRESDHESDTDGDFLPDLDDDSTDMESDSDPDEQPFCSSQPLDKSTPQVLQMMLYPQTTTPKQQTELLWMTVTIIRQHSLKLCPRYLQWKVRSFQLQVLMLYPKLNQMMTI